jgi:hypothetical protein
MDRHDRIISSHLPHARTWLTLCLAGLLVLIAASSLVACAGRPADLGAAIGQDLVMQPGQKAVLAAESLELRFVKVVNDSRCTTGVTCIWAGEVSSLVELSYQGQKQNMVLTQSGSSPAETIFLDYKLSFNVEPYPEAGKPIKDADYRLHLVIERKPALTGGILATFQVVEEVYSIFVTNPATIKQIYALQRGESEAKIPIGRVRRGAEAYNEPWSWHIDSEEIEMVEMTIELSDGLPSHLEGDIDYWVNTVRYYSPWAAKLIKIEDHRQS